MFVVGLNAERDLESQYSHYSIFREIFSALLEPHSCVETISNVPYSLLKRNIWNLCLCLHYIIVSLSIYRSCLRCLLYKDRLSSDNQKLTIWEDKPIKFYRDTNFFWTPPYGQLIQNMLPKGGQRICISAGVRHVRNAINYSSL